MEVLRLYEIICYSDPSNLKTSSSIPVFVIADNPVVAQKKALQALKKQGSRCCKGASIPVEVASQDCVVSTYTKRLLII